MSSGKNSACFCSSPKGCNYKWITWRVSWSATIQYEKPDLSAEFVRDELHWAVPGLPLSPSSNWAAVWTYWGSWHRAVLDRNPGGALIINDSRKRSDPMIFKLWWVTYVYRFLFDEIYSQDSRYGVALKRGTWIIGPWPSWWRIELWVLPDSLWG